MKKVLVTLMLLMILLVIASMTFLDGESANQGAHNADTISPYYQSTQSANATATYGAEQFDIQLTAIANKKANLGAP